MSDHILDTNILIRYLRKMSGYKDLLRETNRMGWLYISAALIAASALQHKVILVTTNSRHFPIPELTILQADEQWNLTLYTAD